MMNKHLMKCWLWKGLWGVSALAFVLAWISVLMQAPIGRFDPLFFLWNALVLGILSIPVKLDCKGCATCNAGGHM